MNNVEQKLIALEKTLNQIEVKGQNNLDKLLGCILTLQQLRLQLEQSHERGE